MLRKVFMIILAACLLVGCAAVPEESTPEIPQGMTPETTEADTRQYVYTDGAFCYHIPVVELPGVNAGKMNEKLYSIYDKLLQEMVVTIPQEERFLLGLTYEVGQKEDVVSIAVLQRGDCDLDDYDVYYFSASTGEELTEEVVFAAFGMTPAEGVKAIQKAMESNFNMAQKMNGSDDPFFLEQKEKTLAEDNVAAAKPLIAENGELQFIGEFYALAGADSYWRRCNLQGEFLEMPCWEHN